MKISVFGAGAWGTALAHVLAENGITTRLWTWEEEHAEAMRRTGENSFLPGYRLHPQLSLTSSVEEAVADAELIVLVVPSQVLRSTLEKIVALGGPCRGLVCASKGVEVGTHLLMSEVVESVCRDAQITALPFCAFSGPSFAKEVAAGVLTNVVAASRDGDFAQEVQRIFANDWLRVYTSSDVTGVEVGGALKNVIAIAAGACEGLGLGKNTQAALITRGVAEMARLVEAKGGDRLTMAGLAGMGDLVLTCTGELSRNRTLGFKLGQGVSLDEALASSAGVAEGFATAQSAHELATRLGVELPISSAVYSVLHGGVSLKDALTALLARPLKAEWD